MDSNETVAAITPRPDGQKTATSEGLPAIREEVLLPVLTGSMFLVSTNVAMMAPLLVDLAKEFNSTVGSMGQLQAAAALPWAIMAPFMGVLSDRYGRRPVVAAGVAMLGLTTMLGALAWDFPSLFCLRMIAGIAGATTGPNIMSCPSDFFPANRRGRAIGFIMAGMSLATIAGIPLLAMVAAYAGWRWAFAALGFPLVLAGAVLWFFIPRVPPRAPNAQVLTGFAGALSQRSTLALLAANINERASFTVVTTYLAAFLMQSYDLRLDQVAPVLSIIAAGALAGSVIGGRLADRGRQVLVYSGFQLATAALAIPLFVTTFGVVATGVMAAAFSIFSSLGRPSWLWLLSRVPDEQRGVTMGFMATANQTGIMLGASIGGVLIGLGGYSWLGWLGCFCALMAAAICRISAFFVTPAVEPSPEPPAPRPR